MTPFITGWMDMTGVSTSKKVEDMTANMLLHPTFDEFWQPRISHRELDEKRSTRYQPYHTHQNLQYATIYEPVLIEVEIWPTSAVIHAGESLQLRISGDFKYDVPEIIMSQHYKPSHSYGSYDVFSGGDYDSSLYIAVRPAAEK